MRLEISTIEDVSKVPFLSSPNRCFRRVNCLIFSGSYGGMRINHRNQSNRYPTYLITSDKPRSAHNDEE